MLLWLSYCCLCLLVLVGVGYGVIERIYRHEVFEHHATMSLIVFLVQPWDVEPGSTALMRAKPSNSPSYFIESAKVSDGTVLYMPAIKDDATNGWTHNLIHLP